MIVKKNILIMIEYSRFVCGNLLLNKTGKISCSTVHLIACRGEVLTKSELLNYLRPTCPAIALATAEGLRLSDN